MMPVVIEAGTGMLLILIASTVTPKDPPKFVTWKEIPAATVRISVETPLQFDQLLTRGNTNIANRDSNVNILSICSAPEALSS